MTSDERFNPATPASFYAHGMGAPDDEIDLFELVEDLVKYKWWLIVTTLICVVLAGIYLFIATPIYKVTVELQQPTPQDISVLHVPGINYKATPKDALASVVRQLQSRVFRVDYWKQHTELFSNIVQKNKDLTVKQQLIVYDKNNYHLQLPSEESQGTRVTFSLTYPNEVEGIKLTSGMLHEALSVASQQLINNWQTKRAKRIVVLKNQLRGLRSSYRGKLDTQISRLSGALHVAKQLGIDQPTTISDYAKQGQTRVDAGVSMQVNQHQLPLYFMGTKVLSSRLALLETRRESIQKQAALSPFSDWVEDAYLAGTAKLKSEGRYLKQMQPDFSQLKAAQITRYPTTPTSSIKPKKLLVMAIGLLLGLMLGVGLALLRAAWMKRKLRPSLAAELAAK